jgi:predicted lipoprotein
MTTTAPTRTRTWLQPRIIGGVVAIGVLAAAVASTTFVPAGSQAVAADTAVEFADLNYESVVVPTIVDSAQPLDELLAAIVADPDAAGEEFGKREDETKPYSFATTATGTLVEGAFGEVGLEVVGLPDGLTAGVAIPPLGSNTAVRDAGTDLTFGDFVNQTEYQNVAIELNRKVVETVFAEVDLPSMLGREVTVTGSFTWVSKTGGEIDHVTIVPVQVEAGA